MGIFVSVDASGIRGMAYADVLAYFQDQYRAIYGADIYIAADSQDGQFLAVISLAVKNAIDTAIDVYNSFCPSTAQGAGLASVIKVNGMQKEAASNSTAVVTIVGQEGVTIINGLVRDGLNLNTTWALPSGVTIPGSGQVNVTVTCTRQGNITASPGTLTEIATPVPGWQTVTNALAASPGAPVETDAALRRRQSRSTTLPAQTPRGAIYANVANIPGVARAAVIENDTGGVTADGIQARSLAVVVQGGNVAAVAQAIAIKKPPGTPTYGSVISTYIDAYGVPDTIRFSELSLLGDFVQVSIAPLLSFTTSTAQQIKAAVTYYIDQLDIGEASYLGRIYAPADLKGDEATSATGLAQSALDILSNTYRVSGIVQARGDSTITNGPLVQGQTVAQLAPRKKDISVSDFVSFTCSDGTRFRSLVTGINGDEVTFAPAVPTGKQVNNGSLVYLQNDITATFDEAFNVSTNGEVAVFDINTGARLDS